MSGLYAKGLEAFLSGNIVWLDDNIRGVLVTAAYTPNFDTDEYLSDIAAGARANATSELLANKTATNGWASTDKIEWTTVTGATRTAVVIVKDTGDAATSPLIAYLAGSITNLPLEPNGAKVTFIPDADTGLFRL